MKYTKFITSWTNRSQTVTKKEKVAQNCIYVLK